MTIDIKRKLFARSTTNTEESFEPAAEINAKQRKVKFTVYNHSWDNINDGKEFYHPVPIFYEIEEYIAKIYFFIKNNDAISLEDWLKSYFIYSKPIIDDESYTKYGREITFEKYKIFNIRPIMEMIILEHQAYIEPLLQSMHSKPECRKAFMNSFQHLNLTNAFLNDLDLSQANFNNTNLSGANFENTILTEADLACTNLTKTLNLTSAQLDSCSTYEKAILPDHIWPYWDNEIKTNIKNGLETLNQYGIKLQTQEATLYKGIQIIEHAQKMLGQLKEIENKKVDQTFKEKFIYELNSHKKFNNHRDGGLKVILTNITLCIVGAGIGYLIAGAVHKAITGRFLFFSRTHTQELIDKIDDQIPRMKCR